VTSGHTATSLLTWLGQSFSRLANKVWFDALRTFEVSGFKGDPWTLRQAVSSVMALEGYFVSNRVLLQSLNRLSAKGAGTLRVQ
jgi:hypothetical protein